ncbi:MAG: hypothetical protein JW994_03095 [Candidatus Omnitrophica bacterium]|nr:hypothetical protein [Candidatus Omnitrophota bacterium]
MRIIIILNKKKRGKSHLMLELLNRDAIEETKSIINAIRCPEVISKIIAKAKSSKELTEEEAANVVSDLILTETNAYWNLV